jgi:hypothetical protein
MGACQNNIYVGEGFCPAKIPERTDVEDMLILALSYNRIECLPDDVYKKPKLT